MELSKAMQALYPLKFKTIFKDKIWGGRKMKDVLGKDFSPLPNCGETWELSGVKDNVSVVANGPLAGMTLIELIEKYQGELTGDGIYKKYGSDFPLLVKFLDANEDLSIQVHPNDEQAEKYDSFGKTEMWYIIQAEPGATLITGFNQDLDDDKFRHYMDNGNLEEVLNKENVAADDVFFIPAGRIHTIGKGILLAEIQQSSDLTFRVYDFDRKDAEGTTRELHVEEAVEVLDYKCHPEYKSNKPLSKNEAVSLVESEFFVTNRFILDKEITRDYKGMDSFVIYTCLEGEATLICNNESTIMKKGDVFLIPASIDKVELSPAGSCKFLETYIPD